MARLNRHSGVLALAALVISVAGAGVVTAPAAVKLLTGKQIKNGSLTSADLKNATVNSADLKNNAIGSTDLRNGAVGSTDLATGSVQSSDVKDGAVTPSDVTMPPPEALSADSPTGNVTGVFTLVSTAGQVTKEDPTSVLKLDWSGAVRTEGSNACVWQLRVNGALTTSPSTGEVLTRTGVESVSTSVLFPGLPAGPLTIEVWARNVTGGPTPTTCSLGAEGLDSTIVATEEVF